MGGLTNDYSRSALNMLDKIKIDKMYKTELQELIEFLLIRNR
jgi:hypothetical protein